MGDEKEILNAELLDGTVQIVTDRHTGTQTVTGGEERSAASEPDAFVGQTVLGHYQILEKIGEGGMSVVYKARHLMLNQLVAIKMLHSHLARDEHAILRFQQEAQSAIRLEHPGIVGVRDFGVMEKGQPYLIMDFVAGRSLSVVLDAGTIDPQRALKLTAQICEALAHAHENGVVHRDIKPSNVIVINEGTANEAVKIVDFGIAKIVFADTPDSNIQRLTQTGESMGSPPYMSPEQCLGMPLDARSDIYSTGCLLYEALTGRPPFMGASAFDTMHMQIYTLPESVARWRPSLPHADHLDAILLRAMAKTSNDRYPAIREMGDALRTTLKDFDKTNFLGATTARARVMATRLRSQRKNLFVGSISMALVLCAVALVWQRQHPTTIKVAASTENQQALAPNATDAFEIPYREGLRLLDQDNTADTATAITKLNEALTHVDAIGVQNDRYQDCIKHLSEAYAKVDPAKSAELKTRYERLQKFALGSIDSNNDKIARLNLISPQTKEIKTELATVLAKQAQLYTSEHKGEMSVSTARTSYQTAVEAQGASSPLAVQTLCTLVSALTEKGDRIESNQQCDKLMALASLYRASHPLLFAEANYISGRKHTIEGLIPRAGIGLAELQTNRSFSKPTTPEMMRLVKTGESELTVAADLYRQLEPDDPRFGECLAQLGNAKLVLGDYSSADKILTQALKLNEISYGQNSVWVGKTEYYLGKLQVGRSQAARTDAARKRLLQDAQQHLDRSQAIFEKYSTDSANSGLLAEALSLNAVVSADLGDFETAEKALKASIKIAVRWDPQSWLVAVNYHRLLDLYARSNLPAKTKTQKIAEVMERMQQVRSVPVHPGAAPVNDLDKPIGDAAP